MLRIFNLRGRTGVMRTHHFSPILLVVVAHRQAKGEHFSQYDNRGCRQLSTGVGLNYNVFAHVCERHYIITTKSFVSETLQLHKHKNRFFTT